MAAVVVTIAVTYAVGATRAWRRLANSASPPAGAQLAGSAQPSSPRQPKFREYRGGQPLHLLALVEQR